MEVSNNQKIFDFVLLKFLYIDGDTKIALGLTWFK